MVIALLLAGIAGFLFLQKVSVVDSRLGEMTTVYVAKKNISSREPLRPEFFEAKEVPAQFVQESTVTNLEGIQVGEHTLPVQQLVSVVPLSEGELLTDSVLKMQSYLTANDKRMVTLSQSDKVHFDGSLETNDRVDLIVSDQKDGGPETTIFMRDVPIVGVAKDENGNVTGVGLEVSLKEAKRLIHKQNFSMSIRVLKAPSEKKGAGKKKKQKQTDQNETTGNSPQTVNPQQGQTQGQTPGQTPSGGEVHDDRNPAAQTN
ncbi:Flp pilus assembly protein CpaB [Melghirimyces algeriensis]|uniref:Flp pilus assembly protein CpaB n=1 Tax=Melghirimyces algeriensis TaxID=910412 RepID=A0A521EAQ6_9BACL|nr:Flp pilus assembly protein CpaB [Melghirimyces algeriensis]